MIAQTIEARRSARQFRVLSIAVMGLVTVAMPASGALTAHYTLDNTTTGLVNNGTDGATSDLSLSPVNIQPAYTPAHAGQEAGIIGSSLRFSGSSVYTATATGNAAADLVGYPFTFSIWVANVAADSSADSALTTSLNTSQVRYNSLGYNSAGTAQLLRRGVTTGMNPTAVRSNLGGSSLVDDADPITPVVWHNIIGVYGETSVAIYVDGKSASVDTVDSVTFSSPLNTLAVGGIYRSNAAGTVPETTARFNGTLDDVGLFDTGLAAADAALINGLGQTSALGLDWHDEAALLNAGPIGSTSLIGGKQWQRVSGLVGATGDYGGTFGGDDAFIVTGADGNGIQLVAVPEPAFAGTAFAMSVLLLRRARARVCR